MFTQNNGHQVEHVVASGALGFDGRGWFWEWPLRWLGLIDPTRFTVVGKTLTLNPRRGNLRWGHPWTCVKLIQHGTVNAVGLTNPGFLWWMKKVAPTINRERQPFVASIFGEPLELSVMAEHLNRVDLVALEVNVSCPNTGDSLSDVGKVVTQVQVVAETTRHPLWVKLSPDSPLEDIVARLPGNVAALAINSVPWRVVFPSQRSPLAILGGGGVSGQAAQPFTWAALRRLKACTNVPVIGPSIWKYDDLGRLRAFGANALSFGAVHISRPWFPTYAVRRDLRERRQ